VPNDPTSCESHPFGQAVAVAAAMILWLIVGGVLVLIVIALAVGAALDTEAQRRESQRLAGERRARASLERREIPLCDDCPFRDFD
jgi:hypothetical protein